MCLICNRGSGAGSATRAREGGSLDQVGRGCMISEKLRAKWAWTDSIKSKHSIDMGVHNALHSLQISRLYIPLHFENWKPNGAGSLGV